jgi:hypothetical protein
MNGIVMNGAPMNDGSRSSRRTSGTGISVCFLSAFSSRNSRSMS